MPEAEHHALSKRLNERCLCTTLDRKLLDETVSLAVNDPAFNVEQLESRPNLLSNVLVFLSSDDIAQLIPDCTSGFSIEPLFQYLNQSQRYRNYGRAKDEASCAKGQDAADCANESWNGV